jgi:hypothetical protein
MNIEFASEMMRILAPSLSTDSNNSSSMPTGSYRTLGLHAPDTSTDTEYIPVYTCFFPHDVFLCFCKVSEYRVPVSDPGILKSIGVPVSDTGVEVSEDRVSDTEKSIGCPSLLITVKGNVPGVNSTEAIQGQVPYRCYTNLEYGKFHGLLKVKHSTTDKN